MTASEPVVAPAAISVDSIETQIKGMAEAVKLLQDYNNRMPTPAIVDEHVKALKELMDANFRAAKDLTDSNFSSVSKQFASNDIAVQAALQAAKEAVSEQNKSNATAASKSEAAFTKLTDQIIVLLNTMEKNMTTQINDLKESRSKGEGRSTGLGQGWGVVVAAGGLLFGAIGVIGWIVSLKGG